jgi:hypothetical protein
LKGRDGQDDPALKTRIRDLEDEQRKAREELNQLLDDIEDHVAKLGDDPRFDKLRDSASMFVLKVRASGAAEAMAQAESALAELAGTRAYEKAKEAADILDRYIKHCNGMGGDCQSCLAFQPTLCSGMGNTLGQLLAAMGMGSGPGGGFGAGSGNGFGASRGGVGLYGNMPGMVAGPHGPAGRGGAHPAGMKSGAQSGNPDRSEPSDEAAQSGATGGSDASVPVQYSRRVGQYFQRILEELGNH